MKSVKLFVGVGMAAACLSAFSETRVLIVREKSCVDEWRVTDDGQWIRKGTWLASGTEMKGPHSITAADGIVYVGDSRGDAGALLKFTPDGGISTSVHRLAGGEFLPDFTVGGY